MPPDGWPFLSKLMVGGGFVRITVTAVLKPYLLKDLPYHTCYFDYHTRSSMLFNTSI